MTGCKSVFIEMCFLNSHCFLRAYYMPGIMPRALYKILDSSLITNLWDYYAPCFTQTKTAQNRGEQFCHRPFRPQCPCSREKHQELPSSTWALLSLVALIPQHNNFPYYHVDLSNLNYRHLFLFVREQKLQF